MDNNLGSWIATDIVYSERTVNKQVNLDLIDDGYHQSEDFLFYRNGSRVLLFDRVCDHNGGRLFLRKDKAVCALHGWELDLSSGNYLTVACRKPPIVVLEDHELNSPLVNVPVADARLELLDYSKKYDVEIQFLNHACLYFKVSCGLKFATDPWVIGSAFNNGWWLATPSPDDVFEKLNGCDFIYISHNHPDHLHPQSLEKLRKNMPILTAGFKSGSTKRILQKQGFANIFEMDFNTRLNHPSEEISVSVLKSGDFRDDSGLLIELGEFKCLLTVDSNSLNFGKLPQNIDLLCSSFAGGASGFPLCIETFSEEEKLAIVTRNRGAIKKTNRYMIERVNPRYFMPYAGFFTEEAPRDFYIKERNLKNSVVDYQPICQSLDVALLNVQMSDHFCFKGTELVSHQKLKTNPLKDSKPEEYLCNTIERANYLCDASIVNYFLNSSFCDSLVIKLDLTSDDFGEARRSFVIDFSDKNTISVRALDACLEPLAETDYEPNRYLQIMIREHEFYDVLANGRPWEDLSIGFQCRMFRVPNIYNSEFWFHFTNDYIGNKTSLQRREATEHEEA